MKPGYISVRQNPFTFEQGNKLFYSRIGVVVIGLYSAQGLVGKQHIETRLEYRVGAIDANPGRTPQHRDYPGIQQGEILIQVKRSSLTVVPLTWVKPLLQTKSKNCKSYTLDKTHADTRLGRQAAGANRQQLLNSFYLISLESLKAVLGNARELGY